MQIDVKAENTHWNCERFYTEAGVDEKEKEKGACTNCDYFPTKYNKQQAKKNADYVYLVERFIREQRANLNPNPDELTPLEYEGVVLWYDIEKQYDDQLKENLFQVCQKVKSLKF